MKQHASNRRSGISARAVIEALEIRQLLSSAGKLDTSFSSDGVTTLPSSSPITAFHSVATQSDGKVIAAGYTDDDTHGQRLLLARFKTDGSLDTSFGSGGKVVLGNNTLAVDVVVASDGKILVGGGDDVYRFTSAGKLDTSFSSDGIAQMPSQVESLAVRPDGKVLVGMQSKVWRLLSNGQQDKAFGYGGSFTATSHTDDTSFSLSNVERLSDGSMLIYGSATGKTGAEHELLIKLDGGGQLDTSFDNGKGYIDFGGTKGNEQAKALAVGSNGKIVALTNIGDVGQFLYRINSNGTLDTSFSSKSGRAALINTDDIAIDSSNRILESGYVNVKNSEQQNLAVARLKSDGSTDTSFGTNGISTFDFASGNISSGLYETIGSDGKIDVAGFEQSNTTDTTLAGVGRLKSS